MKIRIVQEKNDSQKIIRLMCHSEELVIEKNVIRMMSSGREDVFELKRLGAVKWITIPTTGNVEIEAEVIVGEQIEDKTN